MKRHILPVNSKPRLLLQMPKPGMTGTVLRKAALPARARTLPGVDIHAGDREPLATTKAWVMALKLNWSVEAAWRRLWVWPPFGILGLRLKQNASLTL